MNSERPPYLLLIVAAVLIPLAIVMMAYSAVTGHMLFTGSELPTWGRVLNGTGAVSITYLIVENASYYLRGDR